MNNPALYNVQVIRSEKGIRILTGRYHDLHSFQANCLRNGLQCDLQRGLKNHKNWFLKVTKV